MDWELPPFAINFILIILVSRDLSQKAEKGYWSSFIYRNQIINQNINKSRNKKYIRAVSQSSIAYELCKYAFFHLNSAKKAVLMYSEKHVSYS